MDLSSSVPPLVEPRGGQFSDSEGGQFLTSPDTEGKTVVLHLDSEQYAIFEQALLTTGAIAHSRGLLNKEAALTSLLHGVASI